MIISSINFKGGTGKTTTLANLSFFFSLKGKVLLIDTDPQGNLAQNFGINSKTGKGLYDLIENDEIYSNCIKANIEPNIDLLSSNLKTTFLNLDDKEVVSKIFNKINELKKSYDYILIDTRPTQSLFSAKLMINSDIVLITLILDLFCLEALKELKKVFKDNNKIFLIPTHLKPKASLSALITEAIQDNILIKENIKLLSGISNSLTISNSIAYKGKPLIFTIRSNKNKIKKEYEDIYKEIIK